MMGTVTVVLHWFLPTSGDSRTVLPFGDDGHRRPPTIDYLAQIARAADTSASPACSRRPARGARTRG